MRKISNETPNKNWKEDVLKEFEMTSENVRTIDVLGGEFYEEITPKGVRILSDQYGKEILRNYVSGIIVVERYIYVERQNTLYCFYYDGKNTKSKGEFYDCYIDLQFVGDFIFYWKNGKIVKIFEYDLKLVMEDEDGITVCKKEEEVFVGASGQIVMPYEISSSDF